VNGPPHINRPLNRVRVSGIFMVPFFTNHTSASKTIYAPPRDNHRSSATRPRSTTKTFMYPFSTKYSNAAPATGAPEFMVPPGQTASIQDTCATTAKLPAFISPFILSTPLRVPPKTSAPSA